MESRLSLTASRSVTSGDGLAERLERGELVTFSPAPFDLPKDKDRQFLFEQRLDASKKNISYNPETESLAGFDRTSAEQESRLAVLIKSFAIAAQSWLAPCCPATLATGGLTGPVSGPRRKRRASFA